MLCPICNEEVTPISNEEGFLVCPRCGYVFGQDIENWAFTQYTTGRENYFEQTGKPKIESIALPTFHNEVISHPHSRKERKLINSMASYTAYVFSNEVRKVLDVLEAEDSIQIPNHAKDYITKLAIEYVYYVYEKTKDAKKSTKQYIRGSLRGTKRWELGRHFALYARMKVLGIRYRFIGNYKIYNDLHTRYMLEFFKSKNIQIDSKAAEYVLNSIAYNEGIQDDLVRTAYVRGIIRILENTPMRLRELKELAKYLAYGKIDGRISTRTIVRIAIFSIAIELKRILDKLNDDEIKLRIIDKYIKNKTRLVIIVMNDKIANKLEKVVELVIRYRCFKDRGSMPKDSTCRRVFSVFKKAIPLSTNSQYYAIAKNKINQLESKVNTMNTHSTSDNNLQTT